jgi:hypothetical protein
VGLMSLTLVVSVLGLAARLPLFLLAGDWRCRGGLLRALFFSPRRRRVVLTDGLHASHMNSPSTCQHHNHLVHQCLAEAECIVRSRAKLGVVFSGAVGARRVISERSSKNSAFLDGGVPAPHPYCPLPCESLTTQPS